MIRDYRDNEDIGDLAVDSDEDDFDFLAQGAKRDGHNNQIQEVEQSSQRQIA